MGGPRRPPILPRATMFKVRPIMPRQPIYDRTRPVLAREVMRIAWISAPAIAPPVSPPRSSKAIFDTYPSPPGGTGDPLPEG